MNNYDKMVLDARAIFARLDFERMIARCGLKADAAYLYVRFCGADYRIRRADALVERLTGGLRAADFNETLSIFDALGRENPLLLPRGEWRGTNALAHVAQSSPDAVALNAQRAGWIEAHERALLPALRQLGSAPFPTGDAACVFQVFDFLPAVFQYWRGDEDFPAAVHFLWDEGALSVLKYETLYYVMGHFLSELRARMIEIEDRK